MRRFGKLKKLPSGHWQASYPGPDGKRHNAPHTFDTKRDGDVWLGAVRTDILRGDWKPPQPSGPTEAMLTVAEYVELWLPTHRLKPLTRSDYKRIFRKYILPTFGAKPLDSIGPMDVLAWYGTVASNAPTMRVRAYGLLRMIYTSAKKNVPELGATFQHPCTIEGVKQPERKKDIQITNENELGAIVALMPSRFQLLALLACWDQMRFGELTELRRKDFDLTVGTVCVSRAVTHTKGQCHIAKPKSKAGDRKIKIPPHLLPVVTWHLTEHVGKARDSLVFPPARGGCHMKTSALWRSWNKARCGADRDDLRLHDLRHTGATWAAEAGATVPELMKLLGHKSPGRR